MATNHDPCRPIREQLEKLEAEIAELEIRVAALHDNPDAPKVVVEALTDWLAGLKGSRPKLQSDVARCEEDPSITSAVRGHTAD